MVILLMGVAGAGKTTIGKILGARLGWEFVDGDDYHSAVNLSKMRDGIPLSDEDRAPWLNRLRALIAESVKENKNLVLACSALKRAYRTALRVAPEVKIVYLKGTAKRLRNRLDMRVSHFMTADMLESQLATLEEPDDALVIDVAASPEEIVTKIRSKLALPL